MAITKTIGTAIVTSQSLAALAVVNSATVDLTAKYETSFYGRITNGGTGPTIPAAMIIQITPDSGTTWIEYRRQTAGVTASTNYDCVITIPLSLGQVRVQFAGNTVQPVTIMSWYDTVVAL